MLCKFSYVEKDSISRRMPSHSHSLLSSFVCPQVYVTRFLLELHAAHTDWFIADGIPCSHDYARASVLLAVDTDVEGLHASSTAIAFDPLLRRKSSSLLGENDVLVGYSGREWQVEATVKDAPTLLAPHNDFRDPTATRLIITTVDSPRRAELLVDALCFAQINDTCMYPGR